MASSPGHRKWPNHQIRERRLEQRVRVAIGGEVVADSSDVIEVAEDNHPTRYYFPREDVRTTALERTETVTQCPFKGAAHYFALNVGGRRVDDAVWTYEDPYDEHAALRGRLAFYQERIPGVEVQTVE